MKHEIKNNFGKTIYTTEVDGRKHKTLQAKLKQAVFMAVSDGANLGGANLGGAYLEGAYLTGAYRRGAYLEGAYLNVPVIKNIHQEIQKATKHKGALKMGDWHCGTSHCRAGWAVHLAGDAGYELEKKTSTATAAYLIYRKSSDLPFALNFYASNEDALAEINRMAEIEASA